MWFRFVPCFALVLAALTGCAAASGEAAAISRAETADVAAHFGALTRLDIDAAYRLLKDNHPGALPEMKDAQFVSDLEAAHALALQRSDTVRNLDGYLAVMRGFAYAMGDGHINVVPHQRAGKTRWAGIATARHGADWVVVASDPALLGADYAGWRIVSCDGKAADELARERMAFVVPTGMDAWLTMKAGALLIDDGNPFLTPPKQCRLENGKARAEVNLNWVAAGPAQQHFFKPVTGSPGLGVRRVGNGFWISLQTLLSDAKTVADDVVRQQEDIRKSAFSVIDLRGNTGGNSSYAASIIEAIYGIGTGDSIKFKSSGCGAVFRASEGNAAAFENAAAKYRGSGDEALAKRYDKRAATIRAAMARGETLTSTAHCVGAANPTSASLPQQAAKVYVLTDTACFSSCMLAVDALRKLGAVQIGAATGVHTKYMETRIAPLPSGLADFSFVMGFPSDGSTPMGPFVPAIAYDGDIADNAAVEKWFLALVAKK
jgi:hypothetical protein